MRYLKQTFKKTDFTTYFFSFSAIEAWVIVCVLFVFGALIEYAGKRNLHLQILVLKMYVATI